ncbi:MAG: PH domain-containing protein [Micromonosporaceae bacterium]|nr:PH domain-containing protein [Micromonosporaceae bacterium]
MRIRSGSFDRQGSQKRGTAPWRVPDHYVALKILAAVVVGFVALLSLGNPLRLLVTGIGALVIAALALRDVVAPVRLSADPEGITVVTGFATTRRISWDEVERIRVDHRRRFGTRSRLVEVDLGTTLYLFSEMELGAPVEEVVATLLALAAGHHSREMRAVVADDEQGDVVERGLPGESERRCQ